MSTESTMKALVLRRSLYAGGVGIFGAFAGPHMDVGYLIGIWVVMLTNLAEMAGMRMTKQDAMKVATTAIGGIGVFITGLKLAGQYFAWTGVGTVPAVLVNIGTNGVMTYIFGTAATHALLSKGVGATPENLAATIIGIAASILGVSSDTSSTV